MPLSMIAAVTPLPVAPSAVRPVASERSAPYVPPAGSKDHTPVPSPVALRAWVSSEAPDMAGVRR
jgi:hypothetical protein